MKTSRRYLLPGLLGIPLMTLVMSSCSKENEGSEHKIDDSKSAAHSHQSAEEYYTCPMHPEVKLHKAGDCPICHMPLVKKTRAKTIEITDNIPQKSSEDAKSSKIKFYRNPMNPAITSKVPMKDEMGMDYIPVFENEKQDNTSDVAHRSQVELNDVQARLASINEVKVIRQTLQKSFSVAGRFLGGTQISLQVLEADLPFIKVGQKIEVGFSSRPEEVFQGKITGLGGVLDPMTRSLRVSASLSRSANLPQESSLSANVFFTQDNVLAIPEESLVRTGKADLVYLKTSEHQYVPRAVQVGGLLSSKNSENPAQRFYLIREGLEDGDTIAAGPNFLLDSEARLRGFSND